jgi:hypothetical protein
MIHLVTAVGVSVFICVAVAGGILTVIFLNYVLSF